MKRMTKNMTIGLTLTLLGAIVGCAGPATTTKPAAPPAGLSGKVMETMDAGGYTYIHLDQGTKQVWVAAPTMKVSVGQEVALFPGAEMLNFSSKALNRTFDSIIFSGGPMQAVPSASATPTAPAAKSGMPAGHPALPIAGHAAAAAPAAKLLYAGKIVETMNVGNYTYIQLEKGSQKSWAAVPHSDVTLGDEIELEPGTEMGNFTSKSLDRTFDNILFSTGIMPKKTGITPQK